MKIPTLDFFIVSCITLKNLDFKEISISYVSRVSRLTLPGNRRLLKLESGAWCTRATVLPMYLTFKATIRSSSVNCLTTAYRKPPRGGDAIRRGDNNDYEHSISRPTSSCFDFGDC